MDSLEVGTTGPGAVRAGVAPAGRPGAEAGNLQLHKGSSAIVLSMYKKIIQVSSQSFHRSNHVS